MPEPKPPYKKKSTVAKDSLAEYLHLVEEQDRLLLKEELLAIDYTTVAGIKAAHKILMGAVAAGHVGPGVSAEIRVNITAIAEVSIADAASAFDREDEESEEDWEAYKQVRANDIEGGQTEGPD